MLKMRLESKNHRAISVNGVEQATRHNQTTLDSDRIRGVEICTDPYVRDIFKKAGCLNGCGNLGDIEMYRHDDGVTVEG